MPNSERRNGETGRNSVQIWKGISIDDQDCSCFFPKCAPRIESSIRDNSDLCISRQGTKRQARANRSQSCSLVFLALIALELNLKALATYSFESRENDVNRERTSALARAFTCLRHLPTLSSSVRWFLSTFPSSLVAIACLLLCSSF